MKTSILHLFISSAILLIAFSACSKTEPETAESGVAENRKSPIAIASVLHENTYIKVVYGQPYRRGRTVFGDLEPYGKVWRTGANEATEITITERIKMGDETINSGTYSIFTIPNAENWTLILNKELGQWGAFSYNEDEDYKRLQFPVQNLQEPVEAFTIQFSAPNNSTTIMTLKWGTVQVDVPITFVD